jgi:hypothetical protein
VIAGGLLGEPDERRDALLRRSATRLIRTGSGGTASRNTTKAAMISVSR